MVVEITEVRIKLMEEGGERLQAFCSITFDDCFVIRDLKIIEGTNGPFVAMPSRKLTSHCPQCGAKNHLRANHCNECGMRLNSNRAPLDEDGRAKLYADIAHPINSACREMIQDRVIREFHEELERAKQPGYVSRYDDFDIDDAPPIRSSRGHSRGHPTTNYVRPGSERASHVQQAQSAPPAPHKPVAVPLPQSAADSNVPGKADSGSKSKPNEFGAGLF
jgi:stage V sporulation protein G